MLSNTKYIWLKNEENLTDKQRKRLEELLQVEYLDTVKAYDMKLKLQDFYSRHKDYDEKTIFDFENMALDFCNSTMKEMQKFGEMLVRNAVEILNYFLHQEDQRYPGGLQLQDQHNQEQGQGIQKHEELQR